MEVYTSDFEFGVRGSSLDDALQGLRAQLSGTIRLGMVCTFATIDSGITYCQDAHSHQIQIFVFQSAANNAHRDIIVID